MAEASVKRGDVVVLDGDFAIVMTCGPVSADYIFESGFTQRWKHGARTVRLAVSADFNGNLKYEQDTNRRLIEEAHKAREERRRGERIKRGAIHPSR